MWLKYGKKEQKRFVVARRIFKKPSVRNGPIREHETESAFYWLMYCAIYSAAAKYSICFSPQNVRNNNL